MVRLENLSRNIHLCSCQEKQIMQDQATIVLKYSRVPPDFNLLLGYHDKVRASNMKLIGECNTCSMLATHQQQGWQS